MKFTIGWTAHQKIMHWVRKGGMKECSGFGMVELLENRLHVTDVFMVDQVNSGGETEMKPEAIAKKMYEKRNEPGHMNFWWHSHHSMNAYMSKTDVDTIKELGANGWLLATVFNNRGEHETVFYSKSPFEMYMPVEIEPLTPVLPLDFQKKLDEEFEATVEEKTYGFSNQYGYWDRDKNCWVEHDQKKS